MALDGADEVGGGVAGLEGSLLRRRGAYGRGGDGGGLVVVGWVEFEGKALFVVRRY